jgi:hypothetical protein
MLQLGDDLRRKGAPAGDFAKVLGHLAECIGGSVGE